MNSRSILIALLTAGAATSQAATLLQSSGYTVATNELHYDFNNTNKNVWEAVTTDASGNGRVMGAGNNPGNKWGGAGEIIVSDNAYYWSLTNSVGMPGDNYQTTIHLAPEPNWPGPHGKMVIYEYDGVQLSYDTDSYTATVNGSTVGTFAAGAAGVMLQKMNGEFSLWSTTYSADGTAGTWTQRGGEVTSATSGDDFSSMHLFVKPGGGEVFWGYVGDVKIQSLAVPEPAAALLGGFGLLALLRRRR
jgi:hypothetical protein